VLAAVLDNDSAGLDGAVSKLQTQYWLSAAPRLIRLLRDRRRTHAAVFPAVAEAILACDTCRRDGPRPLRTLESVPQSLPFNNLLDVDQAFLSPLRTFLHMIDVGALFSKVVAFSDKETETFTRAVLVGCLPNHGAPRAMLSDSGKEFDSSLFLALAEQFKIASLSKAAQDHHSDKDVERHNAVLKSMVRRLRGNSRRRPCKSCSTPRSCPRTA